MGKRGPPRKPTELKLLQGVPGGAHKLNKHEAKPQKLNGSKPSRELSPEAKKVWRRMAPKLEVLGLLTNLDVEAFGRYCELSARYSECVKRLRTNNWQRYLPVYHEQSLEEKAAGVKPRLKYLQELPDSVEFRRIPGELLRLEQHFGMTPASRSSLSVNFVPTGGQAKDDTDEFLFGARGKK